MRPSELTVSIQRGHCFRKTGSTGTHREQEFVNRLGHEMSRRFNQEGIKNYLLLADEWIPPCDLFIALHIDGSTNSNRRGCSIGYPSDSSNSKHANYGHLWQQRYKEYGYKGGYLPDNYTRNLRYYYGFGKVNAGVEVLIEHGFGTNPQDEAFMFGNLVQIAQLHVKVAKEYYNISSAPSTDPSQIPWPGRYIKLQTPFMRGLDVIWTQQGINELHGKETLNVDGIYGPNTEGKIKDFQSFFKLGVDGIVGPKTWGFIAFLRSLK